MKLHEIITEAHDDSHSVEAYAAQHGLGEVSWMGNGDMGTAYVTEKDTIIKITSDHTELEFAKMMAGKEFENVVNVYDVQGDLIHMEQLNTQGADDMWGHAMNWVEEYGYGDIEQFDSDEAEEAGNPAPDNVIQFVNELRHGLYELRRAGVNNMDLKDDNIGRKANGEWAIFDPSDIKGR